MPRYDFATQLQQYGPNASRQCTFADAQDYCRWLARTHYENFTVASWLIPKDIRQHFYNIYAYCRWADDLSDEVSDSQRSLDLLDWWSEQVSQCYRGRAAHPVFIALADTVERFEIPAQPLLDLLAAFRQDQRIHDYETFDQLLDYCRNSANPVGRLVLYLGRCHNKATVPLADLICTGLQLTNFWQDLRRDFEMGRIYLPRETRRKFGYEDAMFVRGECNNAFRSMMQAETERAASFLNQGRPLAAKVPRWLKIDVELFVQGGLAILDAIRRQDYNVWRRRPAVGKWQKSRMLLRAWWQRKV